MECRLGESMVVVVPSLSQAKDANHPLVPAFVRRLKCAPAELMADRIHRPRYVMGKKNSYESAPKNAAPSIYEVRDHKPQSNPEQKSSVYEDGDSITS